MPERPGQGRKRNQTREYATWSNIKTRCYNENCKSYARYGAKGIRMCDEWRDSFVAFYRDMGPKPSADHSIDRIDTSKGYTPENCRWATREEQARNKTTTIWIELDGVRRPAIEWCQIAGTDYHAFFYRYENGWSHRECIWGREKKPRSLITYGDETKTIDEWALQIGISRHTIASRLYHKKWPVEWCLFGRDGNQKTQPKKTMNGVGESNDYLQEGDGSGKF